jgi:hypothetical protein
LSAAGQWHQGYTSDNGAAINFGKVHGFGLSKLPRDKKHIYRKMKLLALPYRNCNRHNQKGRGV